MTSVKWLTWAQSRRWPSGSCEHWVWIPQLFPHGHIFCQTISDTPSSCHGGTPALAEASSPLSSISCYERAHPPSPVFRRERFPQRVLHIAVSIYSHWLTPDPTPVWWPPLSLNPMNSFSPFLPSQQYLPFLPAPSSWSVSLHPSPPGRAHRPVLIQRVLFCSVLSLLVHPLFLTIKYWSFSNLSARLSPLSEGQHSQKSRTHS